MKMDMQEEIWVPVKGFEDRYEVSNLGRFKSLSKRRGCLTLKERIYNGILNSRGYTTVAIGEDKKYRNVQLHRLVAEAFVPNPNNLPIIDHINGVRNDNRAENLRWCTIIENFNFPIARERFIDAMSKRRKQVISIDENGINTIYTSITEASKITGILITSIANCLSGRSKTAGGLHWKYNSTKSCD